MFETAEKPNYIRLSKMDNLLPWLETQGIERNRFLQVYHSEKSKARWWITPFHLTEDYGVFTFPYVVINGKYGVDRQHLVITMITPLRCWII